MGEYKFLDKFKTWRPIVGRKRFLGEELTPVSVAGTLMLVEEPGSSRGAAGFLLVSDSGAEYQLIADGPMLQEMDPFVFQKLQTSNKIGTTRFRPRLYPVAARFFSLQALLLSLQSTNFFNNGPSDFSQQRAYQTSLLFHHKGLLHKAMDTNADEKKSFFCFFSMHFHRDIGFVARDPMNI